MHAQTIDCNIWKWLQVTVFNDRKVKELLGDVLELINFRKVDKVKHSKKKKVAMDG